MAERAGGPGGEQNAVAEVPGGDPAAGRSGGADEGEFVGRGGAKAGPAVDEFGEGDGRPEFSGGFEEGGDGVGMDGLVVSGLLDGGADDDAAFAARDKIDVWGSQNDVQGLGTTQADEGDLAFGGCDAGMAGGQAAEGGRFGPGSGAVDEVGGGDRAGGGVDGDSSVFHAFHRSIFRIY